MTPQQAESLLQEWTRLLHEVESVELHCDLPVEEISLRLDRRQTAIDQIQQLDAPLKELARITDAPATDGMSFAVRELFEQGRTIAARIRANDAQLVEKALEKRRELSSALQRVSQSKGYFAAAGAPANRPPVIVDNNA